LVYQIYNEPQHQFYRVFIFVILNWANCDY